MQFTSTYLNQVQETVSALPISDIDAAIQVLIEAKNQGQTIFLCGNGGSAATASHMACDLAKNIRVPGNGRFRVIALTDNVPLMTAWGNDTDFSNIFSEQMRPLVQPGDVLIAISTSGNSPNVVKAVEVAQDAGAITIGMTNQVGGILKDRVDYCIVVPSTNIEVVEDVHMVLAHCIANGIRERMKLQASLTAVPSHYEAVLAPLG